MKDMDVRTARGWYDKNISGADKMLLSAAVISFVSGLLFQHNEVYKLASSGWLFIGVCMAAVLILLHVCRIGREKKRLVVQCCVMTVFTLVLMQLVSWLKAREGAQDDATALTLTLALAVALVVWCVWCVRREGGITENTVLLIIWGGFMIRLFYVVMTQADVMQNDLGDYEELYCGHLGYIRYIRDKWRLPDINPMYYYQMYHPPLHHFISAVCIAVYSKFGLETEECIEALQMLPLFYITAILVYLDKLAVQLKCSVQGRCVAIGLAAFLPYSIYLGGAINNDALVTLLMVMSLYYTARWYKSGGWFQILMMAICVGCAMMTKTSGVLVAPAMALVMLWKLIKERKKWTVYIRQFVVFGAVSLPLGLWYHIRCLVKYDMPLGYVSPVGGTYQYIGEYTFWERFQNFGDALRQLNICYDFREGVNDYNIPVSLVKSAVFGESDFYLMNDTVKVVGTFVFWITFFLFILLGISCIFWLFMKEYQGIYRAFFGVAWAVIMISYVYFCWKYPHVCTMIVRYVMTAVYLSMLIMGLVISALQKRTAGQNSVYQKIIRGAVAVGLGIYMTGSVLLIFNFDLLQL